MGNAVLLCEDFVGDEQLSHAKISEIFLLFL